MYIINKMKINCVILVFILTLVHGKSLVDNVKEKQEQIHKSTVDPAKAAEKEASQAKLDSVHIPRDAPPPHHDPMDRPPPPKHNGEGYREDWLRPRDGPGKEPSERPDRMEDVKFEMREDEED